MSRRKKVISPFGHLYIRSPSYTMESGRVIEQGKIIKISEIWGIKFRFIEHVTRLDNGKSWIDCVQLERGVSCGVRSFYPDRIKPLPKTTRKKRNKNRV